MNRNNSFGDSGRDFPLYDPRHVARDRARFRRPPVPELRWCNSLVVPSGGRPARGFLLVRREDYDELDAYSTDLRLTVKSHVPRTAALGFRNLAIAGASSVSTGLAGDGKAVYLVEVTDRRGVLCNRHFEAPLAAQYNVRAPAYPQQFYSPTTDGPSPWTWDDMVGDVWTQLGPLMGPYPGLPFAPAGTPEGFSFPGVGGLRALCQVLDEVGCTVAADLTRPDPYTIVRVGAADAAYDALAEEWRNFLTDDEEALDAGSARVPGTLAVFFQRRNEFYGTEETVRRDGLQWQAQPYYRIDVPAPAPFDTSQGAGTLWVDFAVRFDADGNPLAADVATANALAAQRAQQYFDRVFRGTLGSMRRLYQGALPFTTGSRVDGVRWAQDFRDGRFAWTTELVRGLESPWGWPAMGG